MARSLSATEHQEHGKQFFKVGKYEKALLHFTSAIDECEDLSLSVLDNRAATLEKLSRLDEAIRDGTAMIQLDKQDVRGYLRTGRVLQQSKDPAKHELALKVYTKGMRNVPASHTHYKVLQATHNKLTRAMAPPKSVDPFVVLPVELVEMILGYLEFHHMVRCIGVSRHWKRFIADQPSAWHDIDFSKAKRAVRADAITRYLNRGRHQIKHFTFHRHSSPGSLLSLLKAARNLEGLYFRATDYGTHSLVTAFEACAKRRQRPNCDWLRTLVLGEQTEISLDGVTEIMRQCSGLVTAHFDSIHCSDLRDRRSASWAGTWPSLTDLRLLQATSQNVGPLYTIDRWHMTQLSEKAPKLQFLQIRDVQGVIDLTTALSPPLESLCIIGRALLPPELPYTLQELRFRVSSWRPRSQIWPSLAPLTSLRTVEASGDYVQVLVEQMQDLRQQLPWKRLLLDWRESHHFGVDGSVDFDVLTHCPGLEELGINHSLFEDHACEQLPQVVPQLKRVSLAGTEVTGVGVKALVLGLESLAFLDVGNCSKLNVDAVEWARARGVKVKHSMPVEGKGKGTKIRHG